MHDYKGASIPEQVEGWIQISGDFAAPGNILTLLDRSGNSNFLGRGGCQTKTFKEMYEALLEFQRGGGSYNKPLR